MPVYRTLVRWRLFMGQTGFLVPGDHFVQPGDRQAESHLLGPRAAALDARQEDAGRLGLHGATMTAKSDGEIHGPESKGRRRRLHRRLSERHRAEFAALYLEFRRLLDLFCPSKPNDVEFIAKVLDDVESSFPVDKKRIYATGMSNGAMMCYRLASEMSERIAAIAPVSGTIAIDKYEPKRPMPVLHIHGTDGQSGALRRLESQDFAGHAISFGRGYDGQPA